MVGYCVSFVESVVLASEIQINHLYATMKLKIQVLELLFGVWVGTKLVIVHTYIVNIHYCVTDEWTVMSL